MENKKLAEMVELALGIEQEQERIVGRRLHDSERRWVIVAGFRVKYGVYLGAGLAEKIIEIIDEGRRESL